MVNVKLSLARAWQRFFGCNRGSIGIFEVIIVGIVLVVGVYLFSTFQGAMPSITDPVANETATNVFNAIWQSYGLAVVIPIIIIVGIVLTYLFTGFGIGGGRGR
jgi:flagellar biosynthesis protein FlhB